jgi:hypothetical protein
MYSLFRAFVLALLGLAFAAFGLIHAFGSYPSPDVFARFGTSASTSSTRIVTGRRPATHPTCAAVVARARAG